VKPLAISVDTPEESRDLRRKAHYTYAFLSDAKTDVIRRYDLVHKGAGIDGHDIARPAELLLDRNGIVRWRNLTEDFRVRARPEEIVREAGRL